MDPSLCLLPFSEELPSPEPPAGPSEAEEWLQGEAEQLQKELESLMGQLRAQVQDNGSLSHLNQEQEGSALERAGRRGYSPEAGWRQECYKTRNYQAILTTQKATLEGSRPPICFKESDINSLFWVCLLIKALRLFI